MIDKRNVIKITPQTTIPAFLCKSFSKMATRPKVIMDSTDKSILYYLEIYRIPDKFKRNLGKQHPRFLK